MVAVNAAELTSQELRGRTLYRKGLSSSGEPITAFLSGQTEVKGNMVPCVGCHGLDGRGRAEGGVTPSSVRWQDLVRPYEVTTPTGRKHLPYAEHSLVTAIALGLDPAGNKLHPVMPRYALTRSDADDLIAYLKILALDYDPGVTDGRVRIGALLPSEKSFSGKAPMVRAALAAVFDDVNRAGGLYGRRLELVVGELPEQESQAGAAYSRFIESEKVFALVSSFLAGVEEQVMASIANQKIPLVGGWTLLPRTSPSVFFLDGGLPAQAEALAAFGADHYGSDSAPAILASSDRLSQIALESAQALWPKAKPFRLESAASARLMVAQLKAAKTGVVLALLPATELRALLHEAKRDDWSCVYLIPSAFTSAAIMDDLVSLTSPVFAASQFLPTDITPEGQAEYQRLATAAKLPQQGFAPQFTAVCEARILIEGMKRAGRDLSRERLLESLEGIYDFSAGYRQTVSFGPNRRVGIPQVHIVSVEKTGAFREVTRR
jgi:ABC-type branched-subunit amino acid transport system substrate-binding protein